MTGGDGTAMDEDMEMEEDPWRSDYLSLDLEIDPDYEFDAIKYFDFSREETYAEASSAELWFATATSNPPSPFIARLNMGVDVVVDNVNTLPKFKDTENRSYLCANSSIGSGPELSTLNEGCKVWTATCNMVQDVLGEDRKFINGPFSKGSTLMKPTASQLAKQNRAREKQRQLIHRFPKRSVQTCGRIVEESSENTGPAAKRQKLDGGLLQKVGLKEQADLLHKAPQKKVVPVDIIPQHSRIRITIPREPELETARRAQKIRAQRLRCPDKQKQEERTHPPMFRALPLNRKILNAPTFTLLEKSTPQLPHFKPFNLKTEERALQHYSGSYSSSFTKDPLMTSSAQVSALGSKKLHGQPSVPSHLPNHEKRERDAMVTRTGNKSDVQPNFKARPLNKKILSSKGDMGVFSSTKRETTIPKEFNFATGKRCRQDPPTELFDKLSLNTEAQQSTASQTKSIWHFHGGSKGSKENVDYTVQQGHKNVHVSKEDFQRRKIGLVPNYRSHMLNPSNTANIR